MILCQVGIKKDSDGRLGYLGYSEIISDRETVRQVQGNLLAGISVCSKTLWEDGKPYPVMVVSHLIL